MQTHEIEQSVSTGTTTRIAKLLPDVSKGDKKALDELVTIAEERLLRLIRGKKTSFPGAEQTGMILSDLYLRLRKAVENHKLSDLQHPAGFWKIAADNVKYILLDMARARKRENDRRRGHDVGDAAGSTPADRDDERPADEFRGGPIDPIEAIADSTRMGPVFCLLRQEVLDSVQRLPEPHQTIISMYYYLGLTHREIAKILQPSQPHLHERKVGRIIDQAEEMLRPVLGGNDA